MGGNLCLPNYGYIFARQKRNEKQTQIKLNKTWRSLYISYQLSIKGAGFLTVAAGLLASATFSMGKDLCRFVAGVAASDTLVAFQLWALLMLNFNLFNQLPISKCWIHVKRLDVDVPMSFRGGQHLGELGAP